MVIWFRRKIAEIIAPRDIVAQEKPPHPSSRADTKADLDIVEATIAPTPELCEIGSGDGPNIGENRPVYPSDFDRRHPELHILNEGITKLEIRNRVGLPLIGEIFMSSKRKDHSGVVDIGDRIDIAVRNSPVQPCLATAEAIIRGSVSASGAAGNPKGKGVAVAEMLVFSIIEAAGDKRHGAVLASRDCFEGDF